MRILLILLQYHPVVNPNVYRWSAIAEHWVKQGHEVHIICSWRQGIAHESTENGVFIHRAGPATLMDWAYNLFKIKRRRGEVGGVKARRYNSVRKFLEQAVNWTWRKVYWPDGSCLWYWPARIRAKKLLEAYSFDAMVSVGLPFTAHWIGKSLKEKHPRLQWLVDIEDPFCYSREFFVNNFRLYQGVNRRAEAIVFSQAAAITVTVAQAKERYLEIFTQAASRIWVIPPLFNLSFPKLEKVKDEYPIRLAYFGSFYERVRTPTAFLRLLEVCKGMDPFRFQNLEVHFYGEVNGPVVEIFEGFPELFPIFRFHGLVSRREVAMAMQSMDVLLNIGNITEYHLPSKSVDYLMSGKPVISFSYTEADPFCQLFSNYPLFLELRVNSKEQGGVKNLAVQFMNFITLNRGKRVAASLLEDLGHPYRTENIAEHYLRLFIAP